MLEPLHTQGDSSLWPPWQYQQHPNPRRATGHLQWTIQHHTIHMFSLHPWKTKLEYISQHVFFWDGMESHQSETSQLKKNNPELRADSSPRTVSWVSPTSHGNRHFHHLVSRCILAKAWLVRGVTRFRAQEIEDYFKYTYSLKPEFSCGESNSSTTTILLMEEILHQLIGR